MNFEPIKFVESLKYMGIGMLGVFIIVGIIIVATYGIGKMTEAMANAKGDSDKDVNG